MTLKSEIPSSGTPLTRRTPKRSSSGAKRNRKNVGIEVPVTDEIPSNIELAKRVLENLNIRFTNCTFTYKNSHFETDGIIEKSTRFSLRKKIFRTFEKVREVISAGHSFDKCLFVPVEEEDEVKDYLQKTLGNISISFEKCKFIKRSSTITEKIVREFRKIFSIQFELDYIQPAVIIDQYKFRVKDIFAVYQHVQERIAEEDAS